MTYSFRFMQRFFKDYDAIHAFTFSLGFHLNELECAHCFKNDQFVSHGIIYKQRSMNEMEKVGKRILCSNRYGRSGCGHTFQLYVAHEIPTFRYGATHLFIFLIALFANHSIAESYQQATGRFEARHAWRWLDKLMAKLCDYRTVLKARTETLLGLLPLPRLTSDHKILRHLLPTLARLLGHRNHACAVYQMNQQRPFV